MSSQQQLKQQLIEDGFEKRPYGWRKKLSDKSQYIIIERDMHTGIGADLSQINEFGLRGNPGAAWERVTHLGYATEDGDLGFSLTYRFLDPYNRLHERTYSKGSQFYSKIGKTGFWHLLVNNSDEPIKLFIEWEDEY